MTTPRDYLLAGARPLIQADLAECFNVAICPHFLIGLHASLVCATLDAPWLHYIPQQELITTGGMRIEKGRAIPSGKPGHGIAWAKRRPSSSGRRR